MDVEQFRKHGKDMVDYICNYMATLSQRRVIPDVQPGYLKTLLPGDAPQKGEKWEAIMKDIENYIMPGITHWQHPRFHAYFPAGNSYPSIMGDMLSDAIGCVGFSWAASPACAELEMVVLDWLARMMKLPEEFLHDSGKGGGVLQGSASDCVLVTMLAARHRKIEEIKSRDPHMDEGVILTKLVAYCSSLAHSCVEKAAMISFVKIHQLEVDGKHSLRGATLAKAIEEDKKKGLIPFYACCTLGTTACCSFDNLDEMGTVCNDTGLWLHIDAAYAGSSFICPEFQYLLKGVERANSMNFNPNKWMLVNFDCSVLWVRDREELTRSMIVNPVYLQHKHSSKAVDFRHWGIPLSRRFRSLKLWFVLRTYGVSGLQKYIREHIRLAKIFENNVRSDNRFEIIGETTMGLTCFRLKGINSLTQCLIRSINESGKLHMVPAVVGDTYFIRFAVCAEHAKDNDVEAAWSITQRFAEEIIAANNSFMQWRSRVKKFQKVPESPKEDEMVELEDLSEDLDDVLKPMEINGIRSDSDLSDSQNITKRSLSDDDTDDVEKHEVPLDITTEADDQEVFVCESDLGVGVKSDQTITRIRRQTLLKMISDPAAYNQRVLRSLCFCGGHPSPGTVDSSRNGHQMRQDSISFQLNGHHTSRQSQYHSASDHCDSCE